MFYKEHAVCIRHSEILAKVFIYLYSAQFLSLVDKIAPLIDIIQQVLKDITYFVLVLMLHIVVFAGCFYLLG
jgi:hypothetical protein